MTYGSCPHVSGVTLLILINLVLLHMIFKEHISRCLLFAL